VACRRNRSNYAAHTAQTGQQKEMTTTCMRKHSRLLDDLLCLRSVPTCSSACKYTQKMGEHSLEWVGAKQAFCYCQCKCTVSANVEHMLTYCAGNRRHQRQSEKCCLPASPRPRPLPPPCPLAQPASDFACCSKTLGWQMLLSKGPQGLLLEMQPIA